MTTDVIFSGAQELHLCTMSSEFDIATNRTRYIDKVSQYFTNQKINKYVPQLFKWSASDNHFTLHLGSVQFCLAVYLTFSVLIMRIG
jgi:hypothetical protein